MTDTLHRAVIDRHWLGVVGAETFFTTILSALVATKINSMVVDAYRAAQVTNSSGTAPPTVAGDWV